MLDPLILELMYEYVSAKSTNRAIVLSGSLTRHLKRAQSIAYVRVINNVSG